MNLQVLARRSLGVAQLYFKNNGPTILTGAGVVGLVATAALTARATYKFVPEIQDIKVDLDAVKSRKEDETYSRQERAKDYTIITLNAAKDGLKVYAPAIVVGGLSITAILTAHGMLKKQNTALVAAYGALDAGFKAYRLRVRETLEELGVEDPEGREKAIYRGSVKNAVVVNDENQVCQINLDEVQGSVYSKIFDETNPHFSHTPDFNHAFLKGQQDYANNLLRSRGYVFLNEIYTSLGFEPTQPGQVVGWMANGDGDGYIDFGIYNVANEINSAFVNGLEEVVMLDFNVDGVILNKFTD